MFQKIKPVVRDRHITQFPHCDQRVLHSPKTCQFCDQHPDWQELRQAWGIAFTGWEPDENELQCLSEKARPLEKINRWPGNRAYSTGTDDIIMAADPL